MIIICAHTVRALVTACWHIIGAAELRIAVRIRAAIMRIGGQEQAFLMR